MSSTGFLSHINSQAVTLNVDWFRPHKYSHGSVGVLYLVLLNLPHHERYKLENVIAKNASQFMAVYLNVQSKLVFYVFHRKYQLQGTLEDSLVTWLLKVVPIVRSILILEMVLISVDLTEKIGSRETLPNKNVLQSKHWEKQAPQHNKNFVLNWVQGIQFYKSLSTLMAFATSW